MEARAHPGVVLWELELLHHEEVLLPLLAARERRVEVVVGGARDHPRPLGPARAARNVARGARVLRDITASGRHAPNATAAAAPAGALSKKTPRPRASARPTPTSSCLM